MLNIIKVATLASIVAANPFGDIIGDLFGRAPGTIVGPGAADPRYPCNQVCAPTVLQGNQLAQQSGIVRPGENLQPNFQSCETVTRKDGDFFQPTVVTYYCYVRFQNAPTTCLKYGAVRTDRDGKFDLSDVDLIRDFKPQALNFCPGDKR